MRIPYEVLILGLLLLPQVHALDFSGGLTDGDKAQFNEMLKPVMKVYYLVQYASAAIAAVMLLFAALTFMTAGNDPRKRDSAKMMAGFVVGGLMLVWVTPFVVNFFA